MKAKQAFAFATAYLYLHDSLYSALSLSCISFATLASVVYLDWDFMPDYFSSQMLAGQRSNQFVSHLNTCVVLLLMLSYHKVYQSLQTNLPEHGPQQLHRQFFPSDTPSPLSQFFWQQRMNMATELEKDIPHRILK